jgi:peptide/nickel transport system permease protein
MSAIGASTLLDPGSAGTVRPSGGGVGHRGVVAARRLLRSSRMVVGVVLLVFFVLVALVGPHLVGNPNAFVGPSMAGPSARFWLGTTMPGQNIFYQLVDSTSGTLEVGFVAGALATLVSVVIGIGGGFVGGYIDEILALFSNVILIIPGLPLIIVVASYVRSASLLPTILIIAFTSWAGYARVLRGQTLSIRNRDYVLAARVAGEKTWRIIFVEILPSELAVIVSNFIFMVIFAILTQSTLAFLGIGDLSTLTWGNMLNVANNDEALTSGAWWWFVPPGLCIALVGTALALINFGLDEMLNPRLRVYKVSKARRKG